MIWVLLLIAVISITSGLTEAVPDLDVAYVFGVTFVAVSVGWLLALLPMRFRLAGALGFVFGVEYLLVRVGRLGNSLLSVAGVILRFLWELAIWYWTEQPPVWEPIRVGYLELWGDMGTLLVRTGKWLGEVSSGGNTFDIVWSAIVWGLIIWLYSAWAGWAARRHHRPLLGVLPGSLLLSFVLSYTWSNPYIFLPVVGFTLVLMATSSQQGREAEWVSKGIDFSQGLWSDVATMATGISIALVIAASIAPSISVQKIADWVEEITSDTVEARTEAVADSLGLEQKPQPRASRPLESARVTSLPQRHLIGSGPELSRRVVMVVETGELSPLLPELPEYEQIAAPRHYWRSITYDRYFGRGWATSGTEAVSYERGEYATMLEADYLRPLRQSVRLVGESITGLIHVDGTLISVDEEFDVQWRPPGEMFAATTPARSYVADSVYASLTVEQLQSASTEYPDWIRGRYLRLPDTLPERVRVLARDLTATELTPYDRAVAIEQYLRQYEYTLDVPMPRAGDDIADYFLFELQKGYCDYYATSMVVLARAAGLPSRLVIGYVSGTYDPYNARYVVTEADAHAWPEIYFPEYGWIEFEPTGGRAPIVRAYEEEFIWPEDEEILPLVPKADPNPWQGFIIGQWILLGLGGVALVVALGTGVDSARLLLDTPEGMVSRMQRRLKRHAKRLRVPTHTGDTPNELALAFRERVMAIATAHGFTGVEFVEPAADEIDELMGLYAETWYGPPDMMTQFERRAAVWTWWRLRWRLLLAWLWRRSGKQSAGRGGETAESAEAADAEAVAEADAEGVRITDSA
jgi:transglutaminase-like putative cysteine protease